MSDKTAQATPPEDLREQILSPSVAKNEREWWASKEIQRLQGELDEVTAALEVAEKVLENVRDYDIGLPVIGYQAELAIEALTAIRESKG